MKTWQGKGGKISGRCEWREKQSGWREKRCRKKQREWREKVYGSPGKTWQEKEVCRNVGKKCSVCDLAVVKPQYPNILFIPYLISPIPIPFIITYTTNHFLLATIDIVILLFLNQKALSPDI
ncbi:hypothetical protein P167DRAFT_607017 [Morchella conica CCBAS932]|uniref:Uncharacterized protein n=1 Tax=Morchella conica CCBAS932 TaxID=1392247 RepID=A0A3N4KMM5_9PEZI|nr:hypothetical protein P167DRAFT_607017 [Morchella conica CCBAS932]